MAIQRDRLDASAAASLYSSKLNKVIVEDLLMMNQVVKEIKENAELAVIIQPLENMKFAVATDASFANHDFQLQRGQMILIHENGLKEDLSTKSNLLWWRSGKLQRVINSTLAAEIQSLSKGLADLMWTIVIYKELRDEKM